VIEQNHGGFRESLLAARDRVAGGTALAEAMAAEPAVFDEMTVGLIRVGEHAGNLDEVCEQIATFRTRSGDLRDRVMSAMLYPIIVLGISVAVTIFLMTVVVPMLLTNLLELGKPLPWPTRILKWSSDTLLVHGWSLALAIALAGSATALWLVTERGKRWMTSCILITPVAGRLMQRQAISRAALVISSLLRSGVELVDSLRIAERSSTNLLIKDALSEVRRDLEIGHSMQESFARHRIFPATVGQVFSMGQQSGQLDKMLGRLSRDYDRQAGVIAGRLTSVVEPVLILLLGAIVGFIMLATMLPILEAGNVMSAS
jgi:type II secretory pathway component PulF